MSNYSLEHVRLIEKLMKQSHPTEDEVIEYFKPLFRKYYSLEDLHFLNKYHASKEGKKLHNKNLELLFSPMLQSVSQGLLAIYYQNFRKNMEKLLEVEQKGK